MCVCVYIYIYLFCTSFYLTKRRVLLCSFDFRNKTGSKKKKEGKNESVKTTRRREKYKSKLES